MKYKINNVYLNVNKLNVCVGVVLGKEDDPYSFFATEMITNTEYEEGLKTFKYGGQVVNNLVFYGVGTIVGNKIIESIDQKWIDELKKMGYQTDLLECKMVDKLQL